MQTTFFFYDLETSGLDPKRHRIMQFAGQRTDIDLNPIGDPINILVSLNEDVLPDPGAILVTKITPQQTQEEGYTEAEFLKLLHDKVFTPNTIILGFNSVRFDDEFLRYTLYRNFYDPYEWQWQDKRSRWDLLDVVRMTRALRPEGIEWPVDKDGNPTNRLELLSSQNGLKHEKAHDALSDVFALIAVAKLIKDKQPKLFDYLLEKRNKYKVAEIVNLDDPQPFIYTSGRYSKDNHHTTIAFPIAPGSKPGSAIVYDLRQDPSVWLDKSVADLKNIRFANREARKDPNFIPFPAKEISYNKCPAIAPVGVLDAEAQDRLKIDMEDISRNLAKLKKSGLADKLNEVFARDQEFAKSTDVDGQLYESFIDNKDKHKMSAVRAADSNTISDFHPDFSDERLHRLLLRYKARNHPKSLSQDERISWDQYRNQRFQKDLPYFSKELQRLSEGADEDRQFLLQELQLWAEGIMPAND